MKPEVLVIKESDVPSASSIYKATMRALDKLESLGFLDGVPLEGNILIKPNLTQPPNPSLKFGPRQEDLTVHNHVCTDPFVLKAVVEFFVEKGGEVIVGESVKWPGGARGAFIQQGYEIVLEGLDVETKDLLTNSDDERSSRKTSKVFNPDYGEFQVNSLLDKVDVLVNLGKMKTHSNMITTGVLKNTYGLLEPHKRRPRGHYGADPLWTKVTRRSMAKGFKGLSEAVIQVHEGIVKNLSQVCIVDGFIAGEGDGPLFRPTVPRQEGVLFASVDNPFSMDTAMNHYIGYTSEFLAKTAKRKIEELGGASTRELIESYALPYSCKLAAGLGLGRLGEFETLVLSNGDERPMSLEDLGSLRNGDVFELPTFVKEASNTPLYEQIPDPDHEFMVEKNEF
ncbi:MAG: DUF362 domain-containing protein [Candidatus Hydrothermarchaeaceae archaeon]